MGGGGERERTVIINIVLGTALYVCRFVKSIGVPAINQCKGVEGKGGEYEKDSRGDE